MLGVQVLHNLLSNAIKFTMTGHVIVKVTAMPSTGDGRPDTLPSANTRTSSDSAASSDDDKKESRMGWSKLSVSVKDSGIGIPESRQHLLFTPFAQVAMHAPIHTHVHARTQPSVVNQ